MTRILSVLAILILGSQVGYADLQPISEETRNLLTSDKWCEYDATYDPTVDIGGMGSSDADQSSYKLVDTNTYVRYEFEYDDTTMVYEVDEEEFVLIANLDDSIIELSPVPGDLDWDIYVDGIESLPTLEHTITPGMNIVQYKGKAYNLRQLQIVKHGSTSYLTIKAPSSPVASTVLKQCNAM